MNAPIVPLIFKPVYKDYMWGGTRIASRFGRTHTPEICAESWELSAHPDGLSVVASGPFAEQSLADLASTHGAALTGIQAPDPARFPLLFKLIDARDRLSLQVHPNNANAHLTRGEPKTEMWVVLDRTPNAGLYAGLASGTTPASLRNALEAGTAEERLVRLPVEPEQALFIPGGLVHAIGAGCLIYEVQQNSNTTYRLFDWNRKGADGKPRQLHLDESFKSIDWTLRPPQMRTPTPCGSSGRNAWFDVVSCPYFKLRKLELNEAMTVPVNGLSFHALFVAQGRATVSAGGETVALGTGASGLIPAAATGYMLTPETPSTLFVTTL
jgi:mannose-6-phosphate isomerase